MRVAHTSLALHGGIKSQRNNPHGLQLLPMITVCRKSNQRLCGKSQSLGPGRRSVPGYSVRGLWLGSAANPIPIPDPNLDPDPLTLSLYATRSLGLGRAVPA